MRTLHFRSVERRRTVRVTLCVELIVQGSTENNGTFKVKARTLSVSRHGGMIVMDLEVAMGQKLVLINMNSGQNRSVRWLQRRRRVMGRDISDLNLCRQN